MPMGMRGREGLGESGTVHTQPPKPAQNPKTCKNHSTPKHQNLNKTQKPAKTTTHPTSKTCTNPKNLQKPQHTQPPKPALTIPSWCREQDNSQGNFHDKPRHSICCCKHSTTPALPPSSHGPDLHHIPLAITTAAQVRLPGPRNTPLPQEERESSQAFPFSGHTTPRGLIL